MSVNVRVGGRGGDYTRHNLGVFLGATKEASGPIESTWGLEYGYRFTQHFGVGFVYEKTDEAHPGDGAEVLLGSLYYNPYANWRLGIGVGQEEIGGSHSHKETLYRASVAYHFHVGKFALSPLAAVDWVDVDNLYVFGVAFSRPF
ncbi:hypothetical protein EYC98_21375 [Halieaceae bacterium IMCC14734]|uniref:Porin n=1 Tax=Candidatus Litorirhabdus singularis TaxID=2518993 RepID=A0ABT3TN26_9GAMM|nr:hypothetical protein [Candidatus Litorirhabdus singularis]MCX2983419.1 hypothetical protein [Candidatus Litorirhabdus singularis]